MDKTITVCDLFKVYFLWGKYYYIELLRPLESKDFIILSPLSNSIQFIKDSNWFYEKSNKHRSNGNEYDLVYKAKFEIQLRYKDELIACLSIGLEHFSKEVSESIGTLFQHYRYGIHVK